MSKIETVGSLEKGIDRAKAYRKPSYEDTVAALSHKFHALQHRDKYSDEDKMEIARLAKDYLDFKNDEVEAYTEANVMTAAENPFEDDLFSDFRDVPFKAPKNPKFTFIDLFAGIGGIRLPFTEMGYDCVFSSEWDANAQKTYLANFGEMPFGDITKESVKQHIPKKFDLLLAGFPCQAFSIMGKMKGFEDVRGTMFFEVATILERHRPRAILLENVKQLVSHDQGRTFETIQRILSELGYHLKWKVLNALDFGLPQKRERVIVVGFRDKEACDTFSFDFDKVPYSLKGILEKDEDVDPKLFASDMILEKRRLKTEGKNVFYPSVWHENKSKNISILDHACALRTGASYNYLLINGVRRPSSRELLRFQGFPDSYRIAVSHGEIRRQTGNSVAVPMIRAVAYRMNAILEKIKERGSPMMPIIVQHCNN